MTLLLVFLVALYGLFIGSFLNVVIWRVPRGESVISPRSACPGCKSPIAIRDNLPVLSWLLLRGRCRHCAQPISKRYPLVEFGTAALFAGTAWWLGATWSLPAYLYLAGITVALAMIDLDVFRLPDAIVLPSYPVALLLLTLPVALERDWVTMVRVPLAGCLLYSLLFLTRLAYPKGMGGGDVKLVGILGMYLGYLGWGPVIVGFFASLLLGTLISVPVMLRSGKGGKTRIPFGPFLLGGAYVGLAVGVPAWQWYLNAMGIA